MRVLLLLFALVASGMTASKAAQAEEIVIGLISGPLGSAENLQTRDAVIAAVSEINKGGGVLGKQLAFISRDAESNPMLAHARAVEMVVVDKAQFILIHCGQACAAVASTKLQDYRVSHAVVLTGGPNPADQATALLEAWVERVKAAGKFNLSSRNIGKQTSTVARSSAGRDFELR
jgi:Periplasmic binding protein